jgi:AhpD family alkylhydroperoxidase
MPRGTLPRADTELVILRVAHLCDCAYERHHHERIGRRSGLSAAQVEATRVGADAPVWLPRQRVILRAVDALVAHGDLDDDQWADLRRHLDERGCIELCLLVGHYEMLAKTITTLRIQRERPRGHGRG